jgi:hypothetical protein
MVHIHVRHPFWALMHAIVNVSIDGGETPKGQAALSHCWIGIILTKKAPPELWLKGGA